MSMVPAPHRTRIIWLAIFGVVALALLVSAFVQVERTVGGTCLLDPALRWTLKEVRQGSYESKATDISSGQILYYRLYQFDRPAFLDLDLSALSPSTSLGHRVSAGQAVARMKSSSLDLELAERSTALQEAQGRLATMLGGAKPEEIEHARLALERAKAELDAFGPQYERQQQLHGEGVVSDYVWEEVAARRELLELDVSLAEAELRVLSSDAQPQMIEEARMSIAALEQELATVENMLSAQVIETPIPGWLRSGGDGETLLSVSEQDTMIVRILLPQSLVCHAERGQSLKAHFPGVEGGMTTGTVLRIDRRATVSGAGPIIVVYGAIANEAGLLEEGMQGRARLYCGKSTLLDRLWDDILRVLRQELWPA